jgi:hypothetical protein
MRPISRPALVVAAILVCGAGACVAGAFASSTPVQVVHDTVCPASTPQTVVSPRAGADTVLVPDGSRQLMLCRYTGLNDHDPAALSAQKLVQAQPTVTSLAAEINGLPAPPSGPLSCPADDGSEVLAFFRYASGSDNPVSVALTGCRLVSNGAITRTAAASDLVNRLKALVPVLPPPPTKRNATISGYVRLCGGPAPGRCRKGTIGNCQPGQGCVTTDRIEVLDAAYERIAAARLHHARFSVRVPAGRYRVSLLADGRSVHGRVMATRTVIARAHRTTKVAFQFDVP